MSLENFTVGTDVVGGIHLQCEDCDGGHYLGDRPRLVDLINATAVHEHNS